MALASCRGHFQKLSLRLFNTLSRRTETFRPLVPKQVNIYCCGVTVYDLCHLGHARSYIVWDVLRRYLTWSDYKVTFVQNFTDIDDKILNRAANDGSSMQEVSERNINEFHNDMDALGIIRPDRMPRATQSLEGIRLLIKELEVKGAAYSVDGDVYFAVKKHADYGKLSGRDLNAQQKNADGRVSDFQEAKKRHPFDFALWKAAKEGEPSFPSPWGAGRPGWHIECSAMVRKELGLTIDIHLGGADLIFPHHENEIAQSEVANGKQLSRYWLHNGMVNVGGQKMSKSLGNFTTIRDLLKTNISPMAVRLFVLQAHYRKPIDFTDDALNAAKIGWKGLDSALTLGFKYSEQLGWPSWDPIGKSIMDNINTLPKGDISRLLSRFIAFMDDDLNTSGALSVLFDLARPLKVISNRLARDDFGALNDENISSLFIRWKVLVELSSVVGLKPDIKKDYLESKNHAIDKSNIEQAISARSKAKSVKDFEQADKIREELKELGIQLIDKPNGVTEWIEL